MGNVGNVEVAILLTTTLADKVRFLRTLPFEDVTDHRQNTLSTFPQKRNENECLQAIALQVISMF